MGRACAYVHPFVPCVVLFVSRAIRFVARRSRIAQEAVQRFIARTPKNLASKNQKMTEMTPLDFYVIMKLDIISHIIMNVLIYVSEIWQ
jgi:hypothetical protein